MASIPPVQQLPPQPPYPYYPPVNPIAGPAKVFGIIHAIFAGLSVIGGIATLAIGGIALHPPNQPAGVPGGGWSVGILFGLVTFFILAIALLQGVTAYGLLARKSWGRTLLIVTSIISLISIPIGTILGGFALYFFMRNGAEQDYARLTLGQP